MDLVGLPTGGREKSVDTDTSTTSPGGMPPGEKGVDNHNSAPFWLTRFVILRLLGLVYAAAFLNVVHEVVPLIGQDGLLPAHLFVERVADAHGGVWEGFLALPSLFWWSVSDTALLAVGWGGLLLSLAVLAGYANAVMMFFLWALYMSVDHVGQRWYAFGWESQLLETGFLAVFLCPLLDARPFPRTPPPRLVIWLYRWLLIRLMLGSGLIKIRGDDCWVDLTCLIHHYETQPIPHPLSWLIHQAPVWFHQAGVLVNHVVELVAPLLLFGPRPARLVAGVLFVGFQVMLLLSGNLSFLNWLTLVPALACFDDAFLRRLHPRRIVAAMDRARSLATPPRAHAAAAIALSLTVAWLSVDPVANLLSDQQRMNTSHDRLHLVNSYGAFGTVGEVRHEVILQGTTDDPPTDESEWREYGFKCKPGDPRERPCLITPYHMRLDWLMWFAALSNHQRHPWIVHLMWKLLHDDPGTLGLMAPSPFPDGPPRWIRARRYRYEFTALGDDDDAWWRREDIGSYLPPLSRDHEDLVRFVRARGWVP